GKATLSKTQVNIWMLMDEMVSMLKATIPQNVVIKPELSIGIPFINGDASQIRQIAMNLINNASEAIGEEQGEIKVLLTKTTVTAEHLDKDYHGKAIPPGGYVCLEVTDNGCGMDEETKWRIFEPFYTTKFTGRGLGMSAVLGIIQAHNGALQLFSELGKGTTFKVYLPFKTSASNEDENQKKADTPAPWQGSGTILLVEDEEPIRIIAKTLLEKFGFTVLEAVNGIEALELYRKNAADITLVVTDMGMPVMDGYALFRELKKIKPKLPIIVSSGYGEGDVTSRIAREDIAALINKLQNPEYTGHPIRN
ncbi:MAG: ATP-binding protein, partial [Chlorobiaceae bacterium]